MSDDFTRQWAIRMPDGRLFGKAATSKSQAQSQFEQYYAQSTYLRDVLGINEPQVQKQRQPYIYDTRAEAETVLAKLREYGADMGVTNWAGVIVERICTPFSPGDPAEQFVGELQTWLSEQGGAS